MGGTEVTVISEICQAWRDKGHAASLTGRILKVDFTRVKSGIVVTRGWESGMGEGLGKVGPWALRYSETE